MMIKVVKYFVVSTAFLGRVLYTPTLCYVKSDEKETESMAGKTGQDIKQQIKLLGLSMRLLGTLRYTLGITY
jgi:uncharacterized protein YybS (DUF2232 family)